MNVENDFSGHEDLTEKIWEIHLSEIHHRFT